MDKNNGDLLSNKSLILNSINQAPSRFGHSVNFINKYSIIIFGGAIQVNSKYIMTAEIYLYNITTNTWMKIDRI